MTGWEWPDLASPTDEQWEAIKARTPVGHLVEGVVVARQPFGAFIDLQGALALMELPSLPGAEHKRFEGPDDYPPVGAILRGYVVGHRENNRQVRLSSQALQDAPET